MNVLNFQKPVSHPESRWSSFVARTKGLPFLALQTFLCRPESWSNFWPAMQGPGFMIPYKNRLDHATDAP